MTSQERAAEAIRTARALMARADELIERARWRTIAALAANDQANAAAREAARIARGSYATITGEDW